jgi:uncharacterized protein
MTASFSRRGARAR